jgi:opacity protein-like surface antigen
MKNAALAILLILGVTPLALAQPMGDYRKWEIYGGFSRAQTKSTINAIAFDSAFGPGGYTSLCSAATGEQLGLNSQQFFCKRRDFNGFDISGTYHVNRYVGIEGTIGRNSRNETFVDDFGGIVQTVSTQERLYSLLAGVQLKDSGIGGRRVRPFAHALVGTSRYSGRQRLTLDAFSDFNFVADDRTNALSVKVGGGVDVTLNDRIDLRVIEVDYHPLYAGDRRPKTVSGPFSFRFSGKTAQNYTVGFGVVIH